MGKSKRVCVGVLKMEERDRGKGRMSDLQKNVQTEKQKEGDGERKSPLARLTESE